MEFRLVSVYSRGVFKSIKMYFLFILSSPHAGRGRHRGVSLREVNSFLNSRIPVQIILVFPHNNCRNYPPLLRSMSKVHFAIHAPVAVEYKEIYNDADFIVINLMSIF